MEKGSSFESKVALVTGGSAGIGRSACLAFAKEGAKVVVAARRIEEGEQTVSMIRRAGGEACFVQTDVSEASQVEAMVSRCLQAYGGLDIAFNNAGATGTPFVTAVDYEEETWDRVLDVNLKGTWLCMKHEISPMLERGRGSIVNMSSTAGLKGGRMGVAYYASKHAVIGLTRVAAREYAKQGIRVNSVCPGLVGTEDVQERSQRARQASQRLTAAYPMGRMASPEEVVSSVLWLCSEGASFVTGHSLVIDGGLLA